MASKLPAIAILGLFSFLLVGGLLSKQGSPCGRGWLAFFMLPLAAAVTYSLISDWLFPRPPLFNQADVQEAAQKVGASIATKAGKDAMAKLLKKGLAKKTGGGSMARAKTMMGYALFLAFVQYIVTALVVVIQKPTVPKNTVWKRSFIAAGISFLFSMGFIVAFTIIANVIPAVRGVLMVAENLPIVGNLMNQNIYYAIALSPIHMLSSLAAHGIACSFMPEPPPPPPPVAPTQPVETPNAATPATPSVPAAQ